MMCCWSLSFTTQPRQPLVGLTWLPLIESSMDSMDRSRAADAMPDSRSGPAATKMQLKEQFPRAAVYFEMHGFFEWDLGHLNRPTHAKTAKPSAVIRQVSPPRYTQSSRQHVLFLTAIAQNIETPEFEKAGMVTEIFCSSFGLCMLSP